MKAALIGGGHTGLQYALSLSKLRDVEWIGLCGTATDETVKLAEAVGSPVFQTYEAMMERTDPDIVCVCLPSNRQREYVLQSIERGKHVFCEAPLAFDSEQLKQTVQAAKAKGVHFFVGQVERFEPHFQDIKSKVDKGAIGSTGVVHIQRSGPYLVEAWEQHTDSDMNLEGVICQWLTKDMFLMQWMLGEVRTVYALNPRAPGVDYALVTLRFASGSVANIAGYWGDSDRYRYRIELAGSEGIIRYDSKNTASIEIKRRTDKENRITADSPLVCSPYDKQLADVLHCITAGSQPLVTPEDVAKSLDIAEAAFLSVETGMPVQLRGGE